jgi:FkbH-like protein
VTGLKIAVVSNINVQMVSRQLADDAKVYTPAGYGVWLQELLDKNSGLYRSLPQVVFVLLDGEELFPQEDGLAAAEKELTIIAGHLANTCAVHPEIQFYISNLDCPEKTIHPYHAAVPETEVETEWFFLLKNMAKAYANCHIFGLKKLVNEMGAAQFYSPKLWYLGGMKYSHGGAAAIASQMRRIVKAGEGRKKCLLLDLDNTLWGGVLGECGVAGVELSEVKEGARFYDFQRRVKEIKETGIALGIVSKNNLQDVQEAFRQHPHMLLGEADFAILKINWRDKAENIREIAMELNIGLDAIVFVDDNPVEREAVQHLLPEVAVPDFPADTANLEKFAIELWQNCFFVCDVGSEDLKKTRMYRENAQRQDALQSAGDIEAFLRSLHTIIRIGRSGKEDLNRIVQLLQKTNQFNLTTKRYSREEVTMMMDSKQYEIWAAAVEDKFGDNGMVALFILQKEATVVKIDTFLMSCRVMGRKLEEQLVSYLEEKMKQAGFRESVAYYYPTAKNMPVQDLFERLGYQVVETDAAGNKTYLLSLDEIPHRTHYAQIVEI